MKSFKIIRPNRFFAMEVTEDGQAPQRIPLYAYMTYQPKKGCYEEFFDAGVKLVSLAVYAGDRGINPHSGIRPFRPGFMTAPGQYDFSYLDEDLRLATAGRKKGEVYLLLRVMLEMPLWWEEAHPDARCLDAAGVPLHCSFSSRDWLCACVDAMDAMHRHLEETGWGDYIAGYQPAGGQTEEFIRPVFHAYHYFDYSVPALTHFRAWCRDRYHADIDALNRAWRTSYSAFDEITLPTPIARRYYKNGSLRDPGTDQKTIDHAHFESEEVADFIITLAHRTKALTGGKKLFGAFYGYNAINNPDIGHNAVQGMLDCPDIDFFASPFFYTGTRSPVMDWPFQGSTESAALHGKPWFTEADVRTFLSRPISECMPYADPEVQRWYDGPVWFGPDTKEVTLGQMTRAFARIYTHASAVWWFDMWGGWYRDPDLMRFHAAARKLYEDTVMGALPPSTVPPIRAQLAVFIDKAAADGMEPHYSGQLIAEQLEALGTLGAPYDVYTIEDFPQVAPDSYRMALLLSPSHTLDPDTCRQWMSGGRTLFFVGLPGYFENPTHLGTDTHIASTASPDLVSVRGIRGGVCFPNTPVPMPDVKLLPAGDDIVLAHAEDGRPVIVLHPADDSQTVWSILPLPPTELIREQLLLSGAHLYCYSGDVIYAYDNIVSILASSDGEKRILMPFACESYDVFTGKRIPGTELFADLKLQKGEARILRLEKPGTSAI